MRSDREHCALRIAVEEEDEERRRGGEEEDKRRRRGGEEEEKRRRRQLTQNLTTLTWHVGKQFLGVFIS